MNQDPWLVGVELALGLVLVWFWIRDFRSKGAAVHPHPLPGATPAGTGLVLTGGFAGIALVTAETLGESRLGITHEQETLTLLFAAWTIVAALVEEIIFRGYLAVQNKGRSALWASIVVFSAVFALLHPFLWSWEAGGFEWHPSLKAWFSTLFAFIGSLVFYALRFNRWNASRSLLPCFAAHAAKNAGVILVKALTGFIG